MSKRRDYHEVWLRLTEGEYQHLCELAKATERTRVDVIRVMLRRVTLEMLQRLPQPVVAGREER